MVPITRSEEPPFDAPADPANQSSRHSSLDGPYDAIALVLEQVVLSNTRMDTQAIETVAQRQRDAERDTPRLVHATTIVQLPTPPLPHPHFGYHDPSLGPPFTIGKPY
jgi:hypothetical protein